MNQFLLLLLVAIAGVALGAGVTGMNPFVTFGLLCPLVVVAAVFIAVEILKRRMG